MAQEGATSHIASHTPHDPLLVEVIEAWPAMSAADRLAVLALVRLQRHEGTRGQASGGPRGEAVGVPEACQSARHPDLEHDDEA